ncbi:helix-turn-helix domain-containing protein [Phyllobacterium meliloti]|uniref:helix-turn-helix domain-containing protein n=1 Tax=Phyllobacterium meliloti TaxID=555317 RepID=UPI001F2F94B8|nr:AraC family transcriptional regulator [Phyllobacterium sp. T1293]UGX87258.1 AraC family transcriptional regulator [Phyllobacterium sp. T1293]
MDFPVDCTEDERKNRLVDVLLDEVQWMTEGTLHLSMPSDLRLVRACEQILANPGDKRNLSELALSSGTSVRTLSRLAHSELGIPFSVWCQQVRMLHAIPKLAAGWPITQIALELGYDSPGAFAATFRRFLGVKPSAYLSKSTLSPGDIDI